MSQKPRLLDITSSRSFARLLSGRYRSMVHGSGIEFSELREYAPGDDVRAIDWKTSARTGRIHSKLFREERAMPVWFAFDTGSTMRLATGERTKLDTAMEAFSLLAEACSESRDPYGVIAYDSQTREIHAPSRGPAGRVLGLDMLARRAVQPGTPMGSISVLLEHFHRMRLRHSLVFVFSDETDMADIRTLRALAHDNDIIVVTVLDSFERTGAAPGTHHAVGPDGRDTFISTGGSVVRERFAHDRAEKLARLSRTLRAAWARHLVLDDRSSVFREFDRFFQLATHG